MIPYRVDECSGRADSESVDGPTDLIMSKHISSSHVCARLSYAYLIYSMHFGAAAKPPLREPPLRNARSLMEPPADGGPVHVLLHARGRGGQTR